MQTPREIAEAIVAREGGFVNDPDDPGGPTRYGVTLGTLQRLGIDVTGDGRIDIRDVQQISRQQAVDIYLTHYFTRPKIALLPQALQASVFDMSVNAGAQGVKLLQRLLARLGYGTAEDGVIGPQTLAHAHAADARGALTLADAYGIERRNYYYALADQRPASRKYARSKGGGKGGWIKRAEEFISARFHLSDHQHRERTAKWG